MPIPYLMFSHILRIYIPKSVYIDNHQDEHLAECADRTKSVQLRTLFTEQSTRAKSSRM